MNPPDDLHELATNPQALQAAAGGESPANPHDPTPADHVDLPDCPVCGAPPYDLSLGARREIAYRGSHWSPSMLEHDCDCDIRHPDQYQHGVNRLHATSRQRARLRAELGNRARYLRMLDEPVHPTPGNTAAIDAMRDLQPGTFAYLWGPRGTGKTHLALRAANRLIDDRPARFVLVPDWLEELRASYAKGKPAPDLTDAGVLVLDDLGKEKPTAWVAERVFGAIERMWSDDRTLIVTSQYAPAVTAERLYTDAKTGQADREAAAALMSRLSSGVVHHVTGEDERMRHLKGES